MIFFQPTSAVFYSARARRQPGKRHSHSPSSLSCHAAAHGIKLEVVKHHEAKRGFVLLPRRWVVERSFVWVARFRRLARDYERLASTLAGYHWLAFASLMLKSLFQNP